MSISPFAIVYADDTDCSICSIDERLPDSDDDTSFSDALLFLSRSARSELITACSLSMELPILGAIFPAVSIVDCAVSDMLISESSIVSYVESWSRTLVRLVSIISTIDLSEVCSSPAAASGFESPSATPTRLSAI